MRLIAAALFVSCLLAPPAAAQENPAPPGAAPVGIDADRLPIDLGRIHRELQQSQDLEERKGLNLRYLIHIYGSAPALRVFSPDENLVDGPVPYGAPTHQEIINHITPREYRPPMADFSALLRWLAERNKKP